LDEGVLEAVDLAYRAAIEPQLWPEALQSVTALLGAECAIVLELPGRPADQVPTAGFDAETVRDYFGSFETINPIQAAMRLVRPGLTPFQPVTTDQSWVEKDDLVGSEFYQHFMRRIDCHAVMIVQLAPQWRTATLNLQRSPRRGEFETREIELAGALHRPLKRAWAMGGRLRAGRRVDESLAALAERAATAVLLVDSAGRVLHANPAAEVLLAQGDGLYSRPDGLKGATPEVSRRLAELVGRAAGAQDAEAGGALSLPRPGGGRPLAALIAPASSNGERMALVSVIDPDAQVRPPEERLRALFGLTAAEAQVAAELAAGYEPKLIAERLGISLNTVAVHIARTKAKTDISRQADLVSLVVRIGQA
jgi:DNA-binding CsgD family transcriptional regulator